MCNEIQEQSQILEISLPNGENRVEYNAVILISLIFHLKRYIYERMGTCE